MAKPSNNLAFLNLFRKTVPLDDLDLKNARIIFKNLMVLDDGYCLIPEISTPSGVPITGYGRFFAGDDGFFKYQNHAGTVYSIGGGGASDTFKTWHPAADAGYTWGSSDIVASGADTMDIVAGAGITLNTDITLKAIRITSSISPYTDEMAQDAIGAMIGSTDTTTFTYVDATPLLKVDVKKQMSIISDTSGLKLSGDVLSPGNLFYYGTDGFGAKGWYVMPIITQYTDEMTQEAIEVMIVETDTARINFDKFTPEFSVDVKYQMSLVADFDGIKLDGDIYFPGGTQYYGTNSTGYKGWYSLPTPTAPAGSGTELQYRISSTVFGALPSSFDGHQLAITPTLTGSGTQVGVTLNPTISMSGAGIWTGVLIRATISSQGSGAKIPLDIQTNSSSIWNIDSAGTVRMVGGQFLYLDQSANTGFRYTSAILYGLNGGNTSFTFGLNQIVLQAPNTLASGDFFTVNMQNNLSASTAVRQNLIKFTGSVSQTGSALGYTGIFTNITESAIVGTANYLIDLQVGSNSKFSVSNGGNVAIVGTVGIGITATGLLHIKAGTATANTAPLKFTSGTLLGTPEAGAVEFLTDLYYYTTTNGTVRKAFQGRNVVAMEATTGTFTVDFNLANTKTLTPTGDCTFNATGGASGSDYYIVITATGTSRTLTFNTNFKVSAATLVTGATAGKIFALHFIYDGANFIELIRTGAL